MSTTTTAQLAATPDAGLRDELRMLVRTAWKWGLITGATAKASDEVRAEKADDMKALMADLDALLARHGITAQGGQS